MSKGNYRGGSTLLGPKGATVQKRPEPGGRESTAASERRKAKRATEAKALNERVRTNQKLIRKLAATWEEERGRASYKKLSERRANSQPAKQQNHQPTGALAEALQKAMASKKS